jgi:hypothetical protein
MKVRLSDWVRRERDGGEQLFLKVRIECTVDEFGRRGPDESVAQGVDEAFAALPRTGDEAGDDGLWLDGDDVVGFPSDGYRVVRTRQEVASIVRDALQFKADDWLIRPSTGDYVYEDDISIGVG